MARPHPTAVGDVAREDFEEDDWYSRDRHVPLGADKPRSYTCLYGMLSVLGALQLCILGLAAGLGDGAGGSLDDAVAESLGTMQSSLASVMESSGYLVETKKELRDAQAAADDLVRDSTMARSGFQGTAQELEEATAALKSGVELLLVPDVAGRWCAQRTEDCFEVSQAGQELLVLQSNGEKQGTGHLQENRISLIWSGDGGSFEGYVASPFVRWDVGSSWIRREKPKATPAPTGYLEDASVDEKRWKTMQFYVGWPPKFLGSEQTLHSQVGQDWLVLSMLDCKTDGYFLDLAANDAIEMSNSLALERDFGWNGVCVEANAEYVYNLVHRKCNLVLGAAGGPSDTEVHFNLNGLLGGIVGEDFNNKEASNSILLRTVSLQKVLGKSGAPKEIDYFSLDVQGAESMVMQGFDWELYRFSIITVERPKPDLQRALREHGYEQLRRNSEFDDLTWIDTRHPRYAEWKAKWSNKGTGSPLPSSCMASLGYAAPRETLDP